MREYIHSDDSRHHHEFEKFKNGNKKSYDTELEHSSRLNIFRQNVRYIDSVNRQGLTYRLAINHLADRTDDELSVMRGKAKNKKVAANNGLPFDMSKYKRKDLPDR